MKKELLESNLMTEIIKKYPDVSVDTWEQAASHYATLSKIDFRGYSQSHREFWKTMYEIFGIQASPEMINAAIRATTGSISFGMDVSRIMKSNDRFIYDIGMYSFMLSHHYARN